MLDRVAFNEIFVPDIPQVTTVELEKLRVELETHITDEVLCSPSFEFIRDGFIQSTILLVRGYVWAETKSAQRHEVKYPADWWQVFKARWFPKWALSRWPVHYTQYIIDVRVVYPEFRSGLVDEMYCFHLIKGDVK